MPVRSQVIAQSRRSTRVPNHVDCARSYARRRVGTELSLVTRAMTTCAAATRLRDRSPTASAPLPRAVTPRSALRHELQLLLQVARDADGALLRVRAAVRIQRKRQRQQQRQRQQLQAASCCCIQTELILYLIL